MKLVPSRTVGYRRPGFRAKMSPDWWLVDAVTRQPMAGPFKSKPTKQQIAAAEADADKRAKPILVEETVGATHDNSNAPNYATERTEERTTTEKIEERRDDPSDADSAQNTTDGPTSDDGDDGEDDGEGDKE